MKFRVVAMRLERAGLMLAIVMIFMLFQCSVALAQRALLKGVVVRADDNEPLAGANVVVQDMGIGARTGGDGVFSLGAIARGEHRLVVTYVGFAPCEVVVPLVRDTVLHIRMRVATLALKEVVVAAERVSKSGSAVHVGESALEHIQPTSLADVLQFVPGQLATDGRMSAARQVSLRQAGRDANTALGTQVVIDGVPVSNNASMNRLPGDQKVEERNVVNAGVDLRMLSTDHFEGAEVVRGIASARHGDLNSGAIVLHAKRGVMPYQLRVKVDPVTKLAYLGKGFRVGRGALHLGVDYAYATPDERLTLESYRRYGGQANYTVGLNVLGKRLDLGVRGGFIGTLESEKKDPDLTLRLESYQAYFSCYSLALQGDLRVGVPWLHSLQAQVSADYTDDVLRRERTVVNHGSTPLPVADVVGEHEGVYLPHQYLSKYSLVSKPLQVFARVESKSAFTALGCRHTVTLGGDFRLEKNLGAGYCYDLLRPPAPGNPLSSRPRRYDDVPALAPLGLYAEETLRANGIWGDVEVVAGIRMTRQLNMGAEYVNLRRFCYEPRVNAYYGFPGFHVGPWRVVVGLRGGWGRQSKWPTLDMTAPPRAYFDYITLNYYSQIPENRMLMVQTYIEDARNLKLSVATVDKLEVGVECQVGKGRLEVTAFRELLNSGFTYKSHYMSYVYDRYISDGYLFKGRPDLSVLPRETEQVLRVLPRPSNGRSTRKLGIEYRLSIPKVAPIATSFELLGAYFWTRYDVSEPVEYRPSHSGFGGRPYPYVGIYSWGDGMDRAMANSTLWMHTHLSGLRLIFSTMVQVVWFTERRSVPFNGIPLMYRDKDGSVKEYRPEMANDPELGWLARQFAEGYFDRDREPLALTINFKVTKEVGRYGKISFFANRIWGYLPTYRAKYNRQIRRSYAPFFGAELKVTI